MTTDVTKNFERLLHQWQESETFAAYVKGVLQLVQDEIVDPLEEIERLGDISVAHGVWLDLIGRLFVLERPLDADGSFISDDLYRKMIMLRAQSLARSRSLPEVQEMLQTVMDSAVARDLGDMTIAISTSAEDEVAYDILEEHAILPKPVGIALNPLPDRIPNLRATAQTLTTITWEWDTVDYAVSYEYRFKLTSALTWGMWTSTGTNTTVQLTGLTRNTSYDMEVRGVGNIGNGDPATVTHSTDNLMPPVNLRVIDRTQTRIGVTWEQNPYADYYDIDYKRTVDDTWTDEQHTTVMSYFISGLADSTSYDIRMRSVINSSPPVMSEFVMITESTTSLAAPTNLRETQRRPTSIRWSWGTTETITKYQIRYKLTSSNSYIATRDVTASASASFTVAGLTPGESYTFEVRNVNGAVTSNWTTDSATTRNLADISSLGETARTDTSITWDWANINNADSYDYQYKTVASNSWSGITNVTASQATVSSLNPGTDYIIRVRAVQGTTSTEWESDEATTTISAPTMIMGAQTVNAILWDWVAAAGVSNYGYQWKRTSDSDWSEEATVTMNMVSITGLAANTSYDFRVRSIGPDANSSYASKTVSTDTGIPDDPTNVTNTSVTQTTAVFDWDDVTGAASYDYQIVASGTDYGMTVSNVTSSTVTVSSLASGTLFNFRVRARTSSGTSDWASTTARTITADPTGVGEISTTSTTIRWGWTAVSGATGYRYQYKLTSASAWSSEVVTSNTAVTISGLTNSTSYDFRARSYNASGNSSYSSDTASTTALSKPTGLRFDPGTLAGNRMRVSWNAVSGATSYRVERKKRHEVEWSVATSSTSGTSVLYTFLDLATEYNFRVRAANSGGASEYTLGLTTTNRFLKSFDLASDNDHASGIAIAGSYAYVLDNDDHKVYCYNKSTGARSTSREFDLASESSFGDADDIAWDGTYFYVIHIRTTNVHNYSILAYSLSGTRQTSRTISLTGFLAYSAITVDSTHIYLYNSLTRNFEAYTKAGARDSDEDVTLSADVKGLAQDSTYWYVLPARSTTLSVYNKSNNRLAYSYEVETSSGMDIDDDYSYSVSSGEDDVDIYYKGPIRTT